MEKINFEAGTQVSPAKVTIDNVDHEVTPAVWEGKTPLSPFVLNKMQYNIEEAINNVQALPVGGTTGQVLTKQSDTDGDASWEDSGDTLPIGSIVDYEGDTVPEGYVEVDDFNNANTKLDISKVINFTPQNATNYENYGNCYYYKIGSKVHLHIGILCDNSTKSVIYTMPEGFRPYTTVNSMGRGEDLDKYGMMAIGTDGKIYCISSTKYFVADIEYDVIG